MTVKRLFLGLASLAAAIVLLNLHNARPNVGGAVYWGGAVFAVIGITGVLSYLRGRRKK